VAYDFSVSEVSLCPRCGAYWRCDCSFEDLNPLVDAACSHDWAEAIGVEIDDDLAPEGAAVYLCRLCGIYSVQERVQ
jgi:hypothetical protein